MAQKRYSREGVRAGNTRISELHLFLQLQGCGGVTVGDSGWWKDLGWQALTLPVRVAGFLGSFPGKREVFPGSFREVAPCPQAMAVSLGISVVCPGSRPIVGIRVNFTGLGP